MLLKRLTQKVTKRRNLAFSAPF